MVKGRRLYNSYNEKENYTMNTRLYTNTGKFESILGLVVTTVLVTYAAQNSEKIVNGAIAFCKNGTKTVKQYVDSRFTREVEIWSTLPNGQKYNTGMKTRVNKFAKL